MIAPDRIAAPMARPATVPPGLTRREAADHWFGEALAEKSSAYVTSLQARAAAVRR